MLSQFNNSENRSIAVEITSECLFISPYSQSPYRYNNRWKTIGTDSHPIVQQSAEAIVW